LLAVVLCVVVVFVAAWFAASIPRLVLVLGLHTAGGRLGWWVGDPNNNDGEETFATILGMIGIGFVGTLAVLLSGLVVALERRAWPVLPGAAAVWTLLTLVDVGAWLVGDIRWFG
jgi:hypothetical protein